MAGSSHPCARAEGGAATHVLEQGPEQPPMRHAVCSAACASTTAHPTRRPCPCS